MSDAHVTADGDLSTSDTAVPSDGAKTHARADAGRPDAAENSTRRAETTADKTVIGPLPDGEEHSGDSGVQAQTLIGADGTEPATGDDKDSAATVVGQSDPPAGESDGYQYGATVVAEGEAADATRIADVVDSFVDSAGGDDLAIRPGESQIGRFRILKTLGEGSFGAVYLAEDPQLDRRVAIKVTKVGVLTTRTDVDRFQREAKAAAQLRHPNIVPVYEVGRIGRSSFLAYEFIDGTTLGSCLKAEKKFSPRKAAELMHAIAGALGYAHELGIIHRDMKPDNVLVDQHGQPHIADFGLARRDSGEMDKTREGGLMGTPLYMSPEQASGRSHEADARTDVWSLGVMLREMLTGVLPFKGKLTEILIAVQNVEPPGIRTLDSTLPKDLETICQKCLSKDPALRYADGTELAEELDRYLRGEPILARPLSAPARLARWVKRNPLYASLIGGIILALSLGVAVSSYWAVVANQNAQLAIQSSKEKALTQLQSLKTATAGGLLPTLGFLKDSRDDISVQLDEDLAELEEDVAQGLPRFVERNRLLLAKSTLFPESPGQQERLEEVARTLVKLTPDELLHQVQIIEPIASSASVTPTLQQIAHDSERPVAEMRTALYALAKLAPDSPEWKTDAPEAAAGLLAQRPGDLPPLLTLVRPIRNRIGIELEHHFDVKGTGFLAASVLSDLFKDEPEKLYALARRASSEQLRPLITAMRPHPATVTKISREDLQSESSGSPVSPEQVRVRTNAFLVLYAVAPEAVDWEVLAGGADNSLRTEIIHALPQAIPEWQAAAARLRVERNPLVKQALLLSLAMYRVTDMSPASRQSLQQHAFELYRSDSSPAVHAAARWFVQETGGEAELHRITAEPVELQSRDGRDWFRNSLGQEFSIIHGPVKFQMGAHPDDQEQNFDGRERRHLRLIPRSYAIGMHEVTIADYKRFNSEHFFDKTLNPDPHCPITSISWVDAARYCRWLSEQEGIPEEEMCFPPDEQIVQLGANLQLPDDVLDRTGYRLPTAAEWEYACRAGSDTSRPFGVPERISHYAWFAENSGTRSWPVGLKEPNKFGTFDILGNVWEWCQDWYFDSYPEAPAGEAVVDGTDPREGFFGELRGGGYEGGPEQVRTSDRDYVPRDEISFYFGFRLARTIRDE